MVDEQNKKKVICLYRVSTKGQIDKDDIPMQKTACREFIEQHTDWELYKEFYEKGVSGFKKSASQRDALQSIKSEALNKTFNVLLVFMFDRLGRKEDETPFVVEFFNKQNIEIWSTQEGQQRFDTHVDKLMNYIRFWQASGESEKTSVRVDVKHKQMVKDGIFRGGTIPFGYKGVPSGTFNKKKKELLKVVIDDDKKETVKKIYDYAYNFGYGNIRIARKLNEDGILSPTGKAWRPAVIGRLLRNPIYKGYLSYDKTSQKVNNSGNTPPSEWILSDCQNKDLVIIDENIWNDLQKQREARRYDLGNKAKLSKSPLLFVGIINCGYCGCALTTNYEKKYSQKRKEYYLYPVYRDSTKSFKSGNCEGQSAYSGKKIDNVVLESVYFHLKQIVENSQINKDQTIDEKKKNIKSKINGLEKTLFQSQKTKNALTQEISKCIMGESKFSQDDLSQLISSKTEEIKNITNKISKLNEQLNDIHDSNQDIKKLDNYITDWKEDFLQIDHDKQKVLLRKIIKHIIVYRDEVKIEFYETLDDFLKLI